MTDTDPWSYLSVTGLLSFEHNLILRKEHNDLANESSRWTKSIHSYFIFIVPCIVIFYGMTSRCNNVQ